MIVNPTNEQIQIFDKIKNSSKDLLIKAGAGAGKTSTVVAACEYLPQDKSIMFCAFNKHNKLDLDGKLPEHIKCTTTYALGLSALKRKYPNIKFDENKIDVLIKKYSKTWVFPEDISQEDIDEYYYQIKKLVNICRVTLTLKKEYFQFLIERYDIKLFTDNDFKRVAKILDYITQNRESYDYVDMIFLPAIDNSIWFFPQDYIIVDEFQDISRCQFKIIDKSIKRDRKTGNVIGRRIYVGDMMQSIYGFNGADPSIFDNMSNNSDIDVLDLSYSFRCSKNIIKEAQKYNPNIKALDNAEDGIVRTNGDVVEEVEVGDFVLCRTTAPLIKLFFELLVEGKKVTIKGQDIGLNLIEMITKPSLDEVRVYWNNRLIKERNTLNNKGIFNHDEDQQYVDLRDKVSTLLFISDLSKNTEDLENKIKLIFSDDIKDSIVLSTVHKSKGLEANRVFIIRLDLLPLKFAKGMQYQQERNLCYVAITRAKKELIYDLKWTDKPIKEN
jgi:DNA helicase II / ATP-dependent DNA helicase PcrA